MEEVLNGAFEGEHTVIDLIAKTINSVQVIHVMYVNVFKYGIERVGLEETVGKW